MIGFEVGDVIEANRDHYVFRRDGGIVTVEQGEWLIIVHNDYYQAAALRINTSEVVMIMLLEIPAYDRAMEIPTYKKVQP